MFAEDNLLPISALQHLLYCERQCALIHIERLWQENRYTAEGRIMHERVHAAGKESRRALRSEFNVALRSLRLGLVGQADVVEFHRVGNKEEHAPAWRPFPVEYKRGRAKKDNWDRVQLCAQAICLEEMLEVAVLQGALFYGKTRRRQDVVFDAALRAQTETAAQHLHDMIAGGHTPKPHYTAKCDRCSFLDHCLPKAINRGMSAADYLQALIRDS